MAATQAASAATAKFGDVDAPRLAAADRERDQCFTPGRDSAGTYCSLLADINDQNVDDLGFAWDYHVGTCRGFEATRVVTRS